MALQQGFTEDASGNTVVSGTVTANAGTGTMAVSIATMPSTPVTGTFFQATQPVSGTVSANATLSAETTKVIGTVNVAAGQSISTTPATSATATLTNVASSITSVTLLASNAGRKGMMFYNDSTSVAFVNFGATASATAFTLKFQPNSFYENSSPVYTGALNIIWASANGFGRVTELS